MHTSIVTFTYYISQTRVGHLRGKIGEHWAGGRGMLEHICCVEGRRKGVDLVFVQVSSRCRRSQPVAAACSHVHSSWLACSCCCRPAPICLPSRIMLASLIC